MSLWLCAKHHPVKGRRKRNKKHSRKQIGKCGDIECVDDFVTVWHKYPKIEYNDAVHTKEYKVSKVEVVGDEKLFHLDEITEKSADDAET